MDGSNGFSIEGLDSAGGFGRSVSGYVSGDVINDIIVSAPGADPGDPSTNRTGETYVVFGSTDGFTASFDLSSLDGPMASF